MTKGDKLQTEVGNVVRTFPVNLSNSFASNPASMGFGGRSHATGAGFMVNVQYAPGAEDLVNVMVNSGQRTQNELQGLSGVSAK